MSLLPYYLNDLVGDICPWSSLYDQNFAVGLLNDELVGPLRRRRPSLRATHYYRPYGDNRRDNSGVSIVANEKNEFKVNLDVQQFKPNEVKVKVVDDYVVVEGKHEEQVDKHGFVSRQFSRRYKLPEHVHLPALKSTLSSDGILSIVAPKQLPEANQAKEINVPIEQTNAPAIKESSIEPKQKQSKDSVNGRNEKMETN